ncbi:MAG: rod shape-determining protein [Clostridia bacterium]|nr:rod shape-determining protein [Clostridia bacterium]
MVTKIGLDLGYANITLSDTAAGVYREQSIALIDRDSRRIISVGNSAIEGSEQLGDQAMLVRPFKNGILFDKQITESVVKKVVGSLPKDERIRCVIGVPSGLVQKQEKEIFSIMSSVGVTDCYAVNRALAALIGAGHSPLENVVSVNIGASHTEICIMIDGKVAYEGREAVGGEDFDKAVKQYIIDRGGVNVSLSVARAIKEELGSVWQGKEESSVEIEGTLALIGNKVKMTISSEDIVGVFEKPLHKLLMAVAQAIKSIPLDKVESVFKNGIILTGGGAMIYGMDTMMTKVLGIDVKIPHSPIDSVARGLSIINTKIPVKGRATQKSITDAVAEYYKD